MRSSKSKKINITHFLIFTVIVSSSSAFYKDISSYYAIFLALIALYLVVKTRNSYGIAHLFSAYFVGVEVFFRMTKSGVPWEFVKYIVIILLITGMIVERRKSRFPLLLLLYPLLFIPSTIITISTVDLERARQLIFSTLNGQFLLATSLMYFYKRELNYESIINTFRLLVVGILSILVFHIIQSPSFSSISFSANSNATASGGFSANQVSTAYGLGIAVLGINIYLSQILFYKKSIDYILLLSFLGLGLITFSRGGIIASLVSIGFSIIISSRINIKSLLNLTIKIILIISLVFITFTYIDKVTGNVLSQRYFNTDEDGTYRENKDLTTNRGVISGADLKLFIDSPFIGVGAGMGYYDRVKYIGFNTAPHTEHTRMLGEHGLFGFFAIIIQIFFVLRRFVEIRNNKPLVVIFVCLISYSLLTMMHSATRLALPSLIFGLAFITLLGETKLNVRKQRR